MRPQALPFIIDAIIYAGVGFWILLRQKQLSHILFALFCLATAFWQGFSTYHFLSTDSATPAPTLRFAYAGLALLPALFFHFIQEFTGNNTHKRLIRICYAASMFTLASIWADLFTHSSWDFTWDHWPFVFGILPLFLVFLLAAFGQVIWTLGKLYGQSEPGSIRQRQLLWALCATAVFCLGFVDLLTGFGLHIPPISFVFTGLALGMFCIAIFRYQFLAISAVAESDDERARRVAASTEMNQLNASIAFPLVSQGEVLGYLLLGEKMSEESYSKEDILLLRIVANQAALAYQRVRYMEMAIRGARTDMLGEIAGGFAHEIKTPLANISLPAELTYLDLTDVEQGKRTIAEVLPEMKIRMKEIMEQTVKASDKIEAIRQFSKPSQVPLGPVQLAQVIKGSFTLLDHLIKRTTVDLTVEISDGLTPIRGNPKQLEIVFVNLIKNAIEAMASDASALKEKRLSLRAHEEPNWIVIQVQDSGPGIRKTDVHHLFEAYFTTKGVTGTGMGLFLSQQVIKAHGGTIDVISEEGKGTEFRIKLPKFSKRNDGSAIHAA